LFIRVAVDADSGIGQGPLDVVLHWVRPVSFARSYPIKLVRGRLKGQTAVDCRARSPAIPSGTPS
jgi:hypothetical protein